MLLLHQSIVDLAARGAGVDAADAAVIEAAVTRNRAAAQKRQKARYTWWCTYYSGAHQDAPPRDLR
eukprot:scaffold44988_cov67-Phaeocystis_antarctica.AAC.11